MKIIRIMNWNKNGKVLGKMPPGKMPPENCSPESHPPGKLPPENYPPPRKTAPRKLSLPPILVSNFYFYGDFCL